MPRADGQLLTIQSTGMGGPSAAIVAAELAELGARRLVRVGTCGALDPALELGDLLIAPESLARDGTSRALGAADRVRASPELVAALVAAAGGTARCGPVVSTDLFYEVDRRREQDWIAAGALAVEMEAATLFAFARTRGLQAAAVLIVSDVLVPERRRIGVEELRAAEQRLGEVVLESPAGLTGGLGAVGRLEALESRLDRGQALLDRARGAEPLDALLEPVQSILDALKPLRDAAQTPGEAFEVAGRGKVERAHRDLLGPHGALARLEGRRQSAGHHGVLQQLLGELPDRLFALTGDPLTQALVLGHRKCSPVCSRTLSARL